MKKNVIFLAILLSTFGHQSSAQSPTAYIFSKAASGVSVITNPNSGAELHLEYTMRTGSIFEKDSTSGVNAVLLTIIQAELKKRLATDVIRVLPILESEQIGFIIDARQGDLEKILTSLNAAFFNLKLTEAQVKQTKQQLIDTSMATYADVGMARKKDLLQRLWNQDYQKINPAGNLSLLERLSIKRVETYYQRFFHPANSTMIVINGQSREAIIAKIDKAVPAVTSFFNPEQITRLLELKPIVNFTQHVYESTNTTEEKVGILFQNPGVRYDRRGSYCANILAQIIADETNGELIANYQANNYFASFDLTKKLTDSRFATNIQELKNTVDSLRTLNYITPAMMAKAKDQILTQYKVIGTQNPILFLSQMAKYRIEGDESYITHFADSVQTISIDEMNKYINEYFINKAGIRYILADKQKLTTADSTQRVYDLDESVANLKVMFELNKADLSGDSNFLVIDKITQWMKMNTDFYLQINGFSDKGEYPKMTDKEVSEFMDSVPDFKKVKPFFIRTKTLRPEMIRGLKVMKLFYDRGIPIERMSGTSMSFSSETDAEAIENKKCTFTFEKRKPKVSLYDYRYGNRL